MKSLELSGLKGTIGEYVAKSFIRNVLSPRLIEEERWSHVVLSKNYYKQQKRKKTEKLFSFDRFREDFMVHGFYANRKLLTRYAEVVNILFKNHCTPDGLLMKLRETGRMRRLKKSAYRSVTRPRVETSRKQRDALDLLVVQGDLEVVEVKCGHQARLMSKQKETYNNLIAKDVPLRMIKVKIISFDSNEFLVEEKKFERFI